jgi:transketolase
MLHKSKGGHLGCCMSVVEMLIAMYASVDIDKIKQGAPDRDRVYISKGHCAAALYAVLSGYGLLDGELLDAYHSDGSALAGLVSHAVPGVELSTGALGHGINVAVGCALGLKRKGYHDAKVLVLIGDGEAQEGSVWEALMFASHHRLDNLIVLIDDNRIGSVTFTERVMRLPLDDMLEGFGVNVLGARGHSLPSIISAIKARDRGSPNAIICSTTKGKGVPFAENEPAYHYRPLSDETYAEALEGLA